MNVDQLFEITKLPESTKSRSHIPKSAIYPHLKSQRDKKLIQDEVESIYLISVLSQATTNIKIYESETEFYNEIFFIHVVMRTETSIKKIFTLMGQAFKYPIVVIFNHADISYIYSGKYEKTLIDGNASVRLRKAYPSKKIFESELETIFNKLNLNNLFHNNLKELYLWIQEIILGTELEMNYGDKPGRLSAESKDMIVLLKKEIKMLKSEIKNENQINKILQLQMTLNEKNKQLQGIQLKGD